MQEDASVPSEDNQPVEIVVQKQVELLQQEEQKENEITREQLSLRSRLLNWRTIVPLVVVIALLVYLAQKAHIDPKQTWATLKQANLLSSRFSGLLCIVSTKSIALAYSFAKRRFHEGKWHTPPSILENCRDYLYFLLRQLYCASQTR